MDIYELKQRVLYLEKMLNIVQQEKAHLEDDFMHLLSRMQLSDKGLIACEYTQNS